MVKLQNAKLKDCEGSEPARTRLLVRCTSLVKRVSAALHNQATAAWPPYLLNFGLRDAVAHWLVTQEVPGDGWGSPARRILYPCDWLRRNRESLSMSRGLRSACQK